MSIVKPSTDFKANADWLSAEVRASEEEALATNMRLRETQIELARVAAIARHFEKIVRDREEQGNQKESNDASR